MTDTPMIERVARALAPHLQGGREFDGMPADKRTLKAWVRSGEALDINDATRDDALDAARAAVEAMREPDALMRTAGEVEMKARHANLDCFNDPYVDSTWSAMIDTALLETPHA